MSTKDSDITLPLLAFFKKLQDYDKKLNHSALGFDVYLQLMDALGKGYGLMSQANLYWICKMIWRKPYHDEAVFEQLFNLHFTQIKEAQLQNAEKENTNDSLAKDIDTPTNEDIKNQNTDDIPPDTKIDETKTTTSNKGKTKKEKQKQVSLSFQSTTAAQSDFIETDLETIEATIFSKIFRLRGKYPSIHPRRVEQSLRSLRVEQNSYTRKYLDIPATIERVSNQGFMDHLVYNYRTSNFTKVNLLIDTGGSMVAFFDLENMFKAKIQTVSPEKNAVYYFRNCPVHKLYKNKEQTQSIDLKNFNKKNSVIILSDAGAARGRYDEERIEATQRFLKKLDNQSVVWINPVPKDRWLNTSADYISELVPMFEATDLSFINAVKRL